MCVCKLGFGSLMGVIMILFYGDCSWLGLDIVAYLGQEGHNLGNLHVNSSCFVLWQDVRVMCANV